MWFLTDPWWWNHKIWPTFGQVIFSVLDFWAQTLNCTLLHQSHHILIALLLDTVPKRKPFNIANLGAWAKSTVTKSTKENVSNCTEILKKLLTFHRLTPLNQQCPGNSPIPCCCHHVLYNQLDFVQVDSILETVCWARGYEVIFLLKFHCELNFLEQCWGHAKQIYRHYPPSPKEADLTNNVLLALKSIPLVSMQRFVTQSCQFADAYQHGLTGKQATWARKTYWGHCVMPKTLLRDLDRAGLSSYMY